MLDGGGSLVSFSNIRVDYIDFNFRFVLAVTQSAFCGGNCLEIFIIRFELRKKEIHSINLLTFWRVQRRNVGERSTQPMQRRVKSNKTLVKSESNRFFVTFDTDHGFCYSDYTARNHAVTATERSTRSVKRWSERNVSFSFLKKRKNGTKKSPTSLSIWWHVHGTYSWLHPTISNTHITQPRHIALDCSHIGSCSFTVRSQ